MKNERLEKKLDAQIEKLAVMIGTMQEEMKDLKRLRLQMKGVIKIPTRQAVKKHLKTKK